MKIFAIETSCDETATAIIDENKNIISNLIISQIDIHKEFGGVVPEIAARNHAENLDKLIKKSLNDSNLSFKDMSAIATTAGPGLIGGVITGLVMGKMLSSINKIPFIGVNHLEAHALTIRLVSDIKFPYLLLLLSGGHCQIILVNGVGKYKKLGQTIDDALGEAFDKIGQMLGLEYPGGPKIEKLAKKGDEDYYIFPNPLINSKNHKYNFSFSGLKTAVRRKIETITGQNYHKLSHKQLSDQNKADIAASFQKIVAKNIINRIKNIFDDFDLEIDNLVIAGGVAANQYLFQKISDFTITKNIKTVAPPIDLCTDNAAMVGWAGIERLKLGLIDKLDIKPRARWELEELNIK
jgi:N6-L-threonylcarbamoyladenine synthase